MVEINLEKAFDRARNDVLFNLLSYVCFGKIILDGAKIPYCRCTTRVIINRNLTNSINVLSFVHQACPLSPLLFELYMEPYTVLALSEAALSVVFE